ncbi:MAG TPA: hypothetical protein VMH27_12085 [Puia sp.]|nr:hypothetical protein [Puia sp.]
MKQILLFSPLLFTGLLSRAQITKGTILLGGDLDVGGSSYQTSNNGVAIPKSTTTYVSLYPSIGLAVQNNLVLGLNLGIGYTKSPETKQNDYESGVFLRKYKNLGSRFYFFADGHLTFTYYKYILNDTGSNLIYQNSNTAAIGLGFSPGVAYSLSHRWQLEVEFPNVLNAEYDHTKSKYIYIVSSPSPVQSEQKNDNSEFEFNTSLLTSFQLLVGLRYIIGK